MKKTVCLYVLGCILIIWSCNNSGTANSSSNDSSTTMAKDNFDLSKARTTIEDATKKFSEEFKKSDSVALASHYASDALLMPPNSEAAKKEGILSVWGSFIRSTIKDLKLTTDDVTGNNEMLTETGSYELLDGNNKMVDKGKYVVVWKNENGEWKIFRDIFNSNLPPPK